MIDTARKASSLCTARSTIFRIQQEDLRSGLLLTRGLLNISMAVELDDLVLQKCASFKKGTLSDDQNAELVSKKFAAAIRTIHRQMSTSIQFDLIQNEMNLLIFYRSMKRTTVPQRIRLENDNGDHLRLVLTMIFSRFKKIYDLVVFPLRESWNSKYEEGLRNIFIAFSSIDVQLEIRQLYLFQLQGGGKAFADTLEKLAPFLKTIGFIFSKYEWGPNDEYDEEKSVSCFAAVSQCSNLRTLRMDYLTQQIVNNLSECLNTLKIERFECNGIHFNDYNDKRNLVNGILYASAANENLRYIMLPFIGPDLFCNPDHVELLSRLISVRVYVNSPISDHDKKDILKVLQNLSPDGVLDIATIFQGDFINLPSTRDQIRNMISIVFESSNEAEKQINLKLSFCENSAVRKYSKFDSILEILSEDEKFNGLSINPQTDTDIFLYLDNACVLLSLPICEDDIEEEVFA